MGPPELQDVKGWYDFFLMGKFFCVEKFPQTFNYFEVECRITMDSAILGFWHTVYSLFDTSNHNPNNL